MNPSLDPPWLTIARGEMGIHETPGPESTARIIEYDKATTLAATSDEVPWCSAFVNFCMSQAGIVGTRSAAASSWAKWGAQVSPIVGAIGVIDWGGGKGHVTFIVGQAQFGQLICLGGNQNDAVKLSAFPRGKFEAFRWPALPVVENPGASESTR